MKIILFGTSGMVGQGVLRECLRDAEITQVLAVGRLEIPDRHAKLTVLVQKDLFDYSAVETQLTGYDACFFCLGVSSAGMTEERYRRVTYELTLAAAKTLVKLNPNMTFIYVSGTGTDSTEKGTVMWARVKGETENALFKLPFKGAYMFRPGIIQPLHGIQSKTTSYRILYTLMTPLLPIVNALFPKYITNTERVGRAMLRLAKQGSSLKTLENKDINALGA
jgi:uncharacterized protein YbjT (DUF2867 family)